MTPEPFFVLMLFIFGLGCAMIGVGVMLKRTEGSS